MFSSLVLLALSVIVCSFPCRKKGKAIARFAVCTTFSLKSAYMDRWLVVVVGGGGGWLVGLVGSVGGGWWWSVGCRSVGGRWLVGYHDPRLARFSPLSTDLVLWFSVACSRLSLAFAAFCW